MYSKVKLAKADAQIIAHYKEESLRYIKHISLTDYMSFAQAGNTFSKLVARFMFSVKVFFA
ncbi:hypothetical protein BH09BAC5_BH09BAC5_29710 [soil metagenome]